MKAYTSFLDYVMPHVSGCSTELAVHALRAAAIEFCEQTLIVQEAHDPIAVVAGVKDYDFDPFPQQVVHKILLAWFRGRTLTPTNYDDIRARFGADTFPDTAGTGTPERIYQSSPKTFELYPVPATTEPDSMVMRVALSPTRDSSSCADFLYDSWAESLAAGALMRLHMSPGKPYTDSGSAVARRMQFLQEVSRARKMAQQAYTRKLTSVAMRPFA